MNASAVIPNWNGLRFLQPLFDDLRRQTLPPDEILVIDNGSTDGSQEWARSQGARVLALPSNRGFAAAVNEGVRSAQGRIAAILNNDLRLDERWFETVLSSVGNASFAVGKVLSLADPSRIDGTFDAVCCGGTAWRCGAGLSDGPLWSQPREVRIPPFTAIAVCRQHYLSVGGLDEAFGSYLEDVDFGLRSAAKGYTGRYVPAAVAWHAGSGTLGRWHPETVRYIARNQVLLVARHYSKEMLRRYGWKIAVAQLLWGGIALRHGGGLPWISGKWEGFRRCSEMRPVQDLDVEAVLRGSEEEMKALQSQAGQDLYWRLYFALT
jgi:GT2 family glycosyltransferase